MGEDGVQQRGERRVDLTPASGGSDGGKESGSDSSSGGRVPNGVPLGEECRAAGVGGRFLRGAGAALCRCPLVGLVAFTVLRGRRADHQPVGRRSGNEPPGGGGEVPPEDDDWSFGNSAAGEENGPEGSEAGSEVGGGPGRPAVAGGGDNVES